MRRLDFLIYTGALLSPIKLLPMKKVKTLEEQFKNLNTTQCAIRDFAYKYGKPYDLSKTLTAIAWQESSFGLPEKLENPYEPSGGVFGNSYITAGRRHFNLQEYWRIDELADGTSDTKLIYIKPNAIQIDYIKERLKDDIAFSAKHAVLQLEEGIKKYLNVALYQLDWNSVWAHYNGGTNAHKEPNALRYAAAIQEKIKIMHKVGYKGG